MIQRIQSLYLLISALLSLVVSIVTLIGYYTFNIWILAISLSVSILSAYTIFIYNNRQRQIMLCHILVIMNVVFTLCLSYFLRADGVSLNDSFSLKQFIMLLPILCLLLTNLAKKGIKKDEDLVRSADRLR